MSQEAKPAVLSADFAPDIWRPGEWKLINILKEKNFPGYQRELIKMIKMMGAESMGCDAIRAADYRQTNNKNWNVTIDDVLRGSKPLLDANTDGRISLEDIAQGLSNFHYLGDEDGFTDATCILRKSLVVRDTPIDLPYSDRVPINKSDISESNDPGPGKEKVKKDRRLWQGFAKHLHFSRNDLEKVIDSESLIKTADQNNQTIILIDTARNKLYSRVKDPNVEIRPGRHLWRDFKIHAAALFVKDRTTGVSEIVIQYSILTKWPEECQPAINKMVSELRERKKKDLH